MNPNYNLFAALIFKPLVAALLLFISVEKVNAQTVADVTINTSATTGGTWSESAPWIFTPNAGVTTANILNTELQTKLGAGGVGYNVTINTTNASGSSAGHGDIVVSATVTFPAIDSRTTSYTLTLNATRNITINSAIDFSGRSGACCSIGAGENLTLNASSGSVNILATITANGGANTGGGGGPGYNGGNVSITAGTIVSVAAAIATTGGTASKGAGGSGGTISITGPNGVTLAANLTTNGGAGTTGSGGDAGGNAGNISINDGAAIATTGGGANDGQTGGIIAALGATGTTTGTGGSFTKTGNGTLVLVNSIPIQVQPL